MNTSIKNILGSAALALLLVSSAAVADINTGTGANSHGTDTGSITSVSYGSDGSLESAEFTSNNGDVHTITNGRIDNDIDDFGEKLEKAFENDEEVTITADHGDMTGLKRKRKPKPAPDPVPVPDDE